jgi:hypothetical protein
MRLVNANQLRGPGRCCSLKGPRNLGPVAQLVSAPPCHGGGRRFKSGQGRALEQPTELHPALFLPSATVRSAEARKVKGKPRGQHPYK